MARRRFRLRAFLSELWCEVGKDHLIDVAAQLAFWELLALFPFAIFVLTLVGYVPMPGLDAHMTGALYDLMPGEAARLVDHILHEIIGRQRGWLLLTSLSGALWSASGGVTSAMSGLNRCYDVPDRSSYGRRKLIALAFTACAGGGVIVATAALLIGPSWAHHLWSWIGLGSLFDVVWRYLRWAIAATATTLVLGAVYYFLPNVRQHKTRYIVPGAVVAVLLWVVASLLFNTYVAHFSRYAKTYGALGAVVVLMMWLYLSSFVALLGGEVNAVLDRQLLGLRHTDKEANRVLPDVEPVRAPPRGRRPEPA